MAKAPAEETNDAERIAPAHRGRRLVRAALTVLVISLSLGALLLGVTMRTQHLQLQPVLTGSMRPFAQPGDLILAEATPTAMLHVGDVVAFFPAGTSGASGTPVMHRIVDLTRTGGVTTITTKGDANKSADPWGPVKLTSASIPREVGVVPKLGFVPVWFNRVTHGTGRGLSLAAAGVLILICGATSLRGDRRERGGHAEVTAGLKEKG